MNNKVMASCATWGQKHKRPVITFLVLLVMSISLGYKGYHTYVAAFRKDSSADQPRQQPIAEAPREQLKPSDFHLLFGSNDRAESRPKPADIPKTRLNLTLHGALTGFTDQPGGGTAIIEGNNQDKLYQVGDTLPGGAILSEVHPNHVILMRNGQLEKLPFPDAAKGLEGISAYNTPPRKHHADGLSGDDYTKQPGDDSLEERMRKLKEQLNQANQGRP